MDMSALPRSEISFRRSGSSGLVWDDKFLSGELKQVKTNTDDQDHQENREREPQSYRTVQITPTVIDPPSPKVSGCCAIFGNTSNKSSSSAAKNKTKTKPHKSQNRKKPNTRK